MCDSLREAIPFSQQGHNGVFRRTVLSRKPVSNGSGHAGEGREQFQRKLIRFVLYVQDVGVFYMAKSRTSAEMEIHAQRHSPKDAGKSFLGGRRPESIQHLFDARTEGMDDQCSRTQIVIEEVGDFMGQRKVLLIVRVCSVKKYDTESPTRNQVSVEWAVGSVVAVSNPVPIEPFDRCPQTKPG